ncbi:mCG116656, partial [Mus musculus]
GGSAHLLGSEGSGVRCHLWEGLVSRPRSWRPSMTSSARCTKPSTPLLATQPEGSSTRMAAPTWTSSLKTSPILT